MYSSKKNKIKLKLTMSTKAFKPFIMIMILCVKATLPGPLVGGTEVRGSQTPSRS